tara:strand:+ start:117 stop:290 length:174 start_codon:yes stop_codon:yes gene_type:complete
MTPELVAIAWCAIMFVVAVITVYELVQANQEYRRQVDSDRRLIRELRRHKEDDDDGT